MIDTRTLGHLRPDHADCECIQALDHDVYECGCTGYPLPTAAVGGLYSVRPCSRMLGDPEPGVRLQRMGKMLNRLTPDEARELGAEMILAAGASETQWGQGSGDRDA